LKKASGASYSYKSVKAYQEGVEPVVEEKWGYDNWTELPKGAYIFLVIILVLLNLGSVAFFFGFIPSIGQGGNISKVVSSPNTKATKGQRDSILGRSPDQGLPGSKNAHADKNSEGFTLKRERDNQTVMPNAVEESIRANMTAHEMMASMDDSKVTK
jgi:hypothetical protein